MSQARDDIKQKRIPEIDFWRGLALIVILVDHVPGSGLNHLTPRAFGFSDAAEAFVFLSGVSVCIAYGPTLRKAGFGGLVRRCAIRAGKIYLVQIGLAAVSIAIPLAAAKAVGDQGVALGQGLSPFLNSPGSAAIGVVALTYLPNFSVILPVYVVLLLWAPVIILLASRSPASALLASVGVYLAGRGHFWMLTDGWAYNPFTWQLVFAIGILCALTWRNGLPRRQRRLVVFAVALLLGAAVLSIHAVGRMAAAYPYLDLAKSELGAVRLAHFLLLAYVIATLAIVEPWAARMSRMVGSRMGRSVQGMGRNSLLFYTLGSVLSAGGRSLMAAANSLAAPALSVHLIGFVYTAAAVVGMFAVVHRMDRTARPLARSTENRNAPTVSMNSLRSEGDQGAAVPYP
jgi:hypothetical protein